MGEDLRKHELGKLNRGKNQVNTHSRLFGYCELNLSLFFTEEPLRVTVRDWQRNDKLP